MFANHAALAGCRRDSRESPLVDIKPREIARNRMTAFGGDALADEVFRVSANA